MTRKVTSLVEKCDETFQTRIEADHYLFDRLPGWFLLDMENRDRLIYKLLEKGAQQDSSRPTDQLSYEHIQPTPSLAMWHDEASDPIRLMEPIMPDGGIGRAGSYDANMPTAPSVPAAITRHASDTIFDPQKFQQLRQDREEMPDREMPNGEMARSRTAPIVSIYDQKPRFSVLNVKVWSRTRAKTLETRALLDTGSDHNLVFEGFLKHDLRDPYQRCVDGAIPPLRSGGGPVKVIGQVLLKIFPDKKNKRTGEMEGHLPEYLTFDVIETNVLGNLILGCEYAEENAAINRLVKGTRKDTAGMLLHRSPLPPARTDGLSFL